jgi:hypothetical protein
MLLFVDFGDVGGLPLIDMDPSIACLPIEIRASLLGRAIDYVRALKSDGHQAFRSKVMFVGRQAVGKTSLFLSLLPLGCRTNRGDVHLAGPNLLYGTFDGHYRKLLTADTICTMDGAFTLLLSPRGVESSKPLTFKVIEALDVSGEFSSREHPVVSPLSKAIKIVFPDHNICRSWYEYITHWTDNAASVGIQTTFRHFSGNNLVFMDFAGQEEYV